MRPDFNKYEITGKINSMSQVINYTRLTTSDRLFDRFATCQVYEPDDPHKAKAGKLFCHIEIMGSWLVNSQIGQTVINTLIREYYAGENSSELVNFESAVKKINETLSGIAQSGETDWIGRFSSVLALINGSDIHFAQTGNSHAYLYRGGKINYVTDNQEADNSPHPLKTFTNLTSGTLEINDKIVIANKIFFGTIKPTELKLTVTSENPTTAIIDCAKVLKSRAVKSANAIIIELTTKDALANLHPSEKIDTIYIDQSYSTIFSKAKKSTQKVIGTLARVANKGASIVKNMNFGSVIPKRRVRHPQTPENASKQNPLFQSINLKEDDTERAHHNKLGGSAQKIKHIKVLSKTKNKLRRNLLRLRLYIHKKPRRLIIALASVLIIFAITISFSAVRNFKKEKVNNDVQLVTDLNNLLDEANRQVSQNNKNKAVDLFNQALGFNLNKMTESSKNSFADKLSKAKDKLFEIEGISIAKKMAQFSNLKTPLVTTSSNGFYLLNKDGQVDSVSATTFEKKNLFEVDGNVSSSSGFFYLEDQGIFAAIQNSQILTFEPEKTKVVQEKTSIKSTAYKTFGLSLYYATPEATQIEKSTYDNGQFDNAVTYLKESQPRKIVDFAIDGSIYILQDDKKIHRFSRGSEVNSFDAPNDNLNWNTIATDENASSIVLTAQDNFGVRLLELKKTGAPIKQFEIEQKNVSKLSILVSKRLVTVTSDDQIYVYSF